MTVSSYAKKLIVENNPTAKVTIAHPGVNLSIFNPEKRIVKIRRRESW
jgi:hypothetical protein